VVGDGFGRRELRSAGKGVLQEAASGGGGGGR
jgi:hypothetical protein